MDETGYEILFIGPADDTVEERERVIQGLQARFNLSRKRSEQLLQRAPIVVKRGLTENERDRYIEALHSIGAMVQVRKYGENIREERGPTPYRSAEKGKYCPWEDMERLGFFEAFLTTLREVLFSPTQFYGRMPTSRGLTNPLIFALILGVLGGVLGLTWQQVFTVQLEQFPLSTTHLVGITIALPFLVLVGLYIISAIVHLCLVVVGGNRKGFEATFRVIAYSWSTQIFTLVPLVGSFIIPIYALVIAIIGLRESHGIGSGRATLAIFLPFIAIVVFFMVVGISLLYKLSEFL
ncbi:MAG: YIP1 family protein [Deltaproteobacteria bacterium]|nr:YIP1 family protein [Deltaproteobacteria bacterium]